MHENECEIYTVHSDFGASTTQSLSKLMQIVNLDDSEYGWSTTVNPKVKWINLHTLPKII